MPDKYRLENAKIDDASECLKGLMRELTWLEKNGWSIVQTSNNDIIGQGCGLYDLQENNSVDVHIHMMKNVTHASPFVIFEDVTTKKELKS